MEVNKVSYDNRIIFVDGLSQSGKTLIERVIETYDNVELHSIFDTFESIIWMYNINKIDEDAAVYLLKMIIDREVYNKNISRNINTRLSDVTSVFKYPYPLKYLKRAIQKKINIDSSSITNVSIHGGISNFKLLNNAFGDRLKIISIIRSPLIQVSYLSSYDFFKSPFRPSLTTFSINHNGVDIPSFAVDWKDEYIKMNNIERLLNYYYHSLYKDYCSYIELTKKEKDKIYLLRFEDFVTNPFMICNDLEKFMGTKIGRKLYQTIKNQGCPRKCDSAKNVKSLFTIRDEYKYLIKDCEEVYHKFSDIIKNEHSCNCPST